MSHPGTTDLDARYGRTRSSRRRTVLLAVVAFAAVAAVVVAWVVWVGLFQPAASLEAKDTGYTLHDDGTVEVRFEVNAPARTPVTCALQALDEQFGIVGWKVVELPESDERSRSFRESVHTSSDAVTGLLYRCWLT